MCRPSALKLGRTVSRWPRSRLTTLPRAGRPRRGTVVAADDEQPAARHVPHAADRSARDHAEARAAAASVRRSA